MKNPNIGKTLRHYRLLASLTVENTVSQLAERGIHVSPKTIYGWEGGFSQPDADTLLILCEIYHIDNILEAFGYTGEEKEPLNLTDFEIKLIRAYRRKEEMQPAVNKLLDL